jgi:hemoglobin
MGKVEFLEWLRLFYDTVDELFEGEKAELAKYRGRTIAGIMLYKIEDSSHIQHG